MFILILPLQNLHLRAFTAPTAQTLVALISWFSLNFLLYLLIQTLTLSCKNADISL